MNPSLSWLIGSSSIVLNTVFYPTAPHTYIYIYMYVYYIYIYIYVYSMCIYILCIWLAPALGPEVQDWDLL